MDLAKTSSGPLETASRVVAARGIRVEDLAQRFAIALQRQGGSVVLSKTVNQYCDIQILAYMAYVCLFDGGLTKKVIKQRRQKATRRLREHAREVTSQMRRLHAAGHDEGVAQAQAELKNVGKIIANVRGNRVYDTKREGIAMNSRMLWILREYVQARSGRAVKFPDLAKILDAAQRAVYPETTAKFDPELIRRNLQAFEKTRQTLLARAQQR